MQLKTMLMIGNVEQSTLDHVTEAITKPRNEYRFESISPDALEKYIEAVLGVEHELQHDFRSYGVLRRKKKALWQKFIADHVAIFRLQINVDRPQDVIALIFADDAYARCAGVTLEHLHIQGAVHRPTIVDRLTVICPNAKHVYRGTVKV